jgi:RNA polymerase sigma-70 factor (ECF subfamily)
VKKNLRHIIQLLQNKDQRGMESLYDLYSGPIFGVISRIVEDKDLANDALQDTFVKIWKNFDKYDESRAHLFTWMYRIARNTALDYQKEIVKYRSSEIQNAENNVSYSSKMNIESLDVEPQINNLPEKYRSVIYALFFKGYSQREWAKESGLPLGTIKTRLRIGLRELRSIYDKGVLIFLMIIIDSIC